MEADITDIERLLGQFTNLGKASGVYGEVSQTERLLDVRRQAGKTQRHRRRNAQPWGIDRIDQNKGKSLSLACTQALITKLCRPP